MSKIENKQRSNNSNQELPESLKNLPVKIARMKAEVYKALGLMTVATMILSSCAPEGNAQEIQPALSQEAEDLDLAPAELEPTLSETSTPTKTATPENTPTTTPTPTPEASPTPEPIVIPDHLEWDGWEIVMRPELKEVNYGPYTTLDIPFKIRPQDVHLTEPFTMDNGRYYVQIWADAWIAIPLDENVRREHSEIEMRHISVPLTVYDLQEDKLWSVHQGIITENHPGARAYFTKPYDPTDLSVYSQYGGITNFLKKLNEDGKRYSIDLETGEQDMNFQLNCLSFILGQIPEEGFSDNNDYTVMLEPFVEFWRDLLGDVYTEETIQQFNETLDLDLLQPQIEEDLPENFIIPIHVDR